MIFFNAIKKHPSASVKPANQCKSFIFLFTISGLKVISKKGKDKLKASEISPLFSVALIETIALKPFKVRCFRALRATVSLNL